MATYLEIFKRLRIEMNGAVSQSMREGGIVGLMNYGVSLPTIKDVALEYAPDHRLAGELWRQEIREMRIAALLVEDPSLVTLDQMRLWGDGMATVEVAQISSKELWSRVSGSEQVALEWYLGDDSVKVESARATVGWMASRLESDFLSQFIDLRGNAFMLREIYRYHPCLRERITAISDSIFDLGWQLEMID
ncbi:MAG: DNA alkylation repair protein [Rikenellaceae bacterium]